MLINNAARQAGWRTGIGHSVSKLRNDDRGNLCEVAASQTPLPKLPTQVEPPQLFRKPFIIIWAFVEIIHLK